MARNNYSYKKYQKELAKKKKNEEKRQRKLDKKNLKTASAGDSGQAFRSPESPASAGDSGQASNEGGTVV